MNTSWVEVASALGLVESPVSSDDIAQQLQEILRIPDDSTAREIAYHLYSNQLEDVMSSEHIEAIDGLDVNQRLRFRCMAALGMPSYSLSVEMVLREILDDPRLLQNTMSREVFEKFSTLPAANETFPQGAVAGFAFAMLGRALCGMSPPALISADLRDLVWSAWGAILYSTAVPNLSSDDRRAQTAPAWRALRAHAEHAPGPLFELHQHERFMRWEGRTILASCTTGQSKFAIYSSAP